MSQAAKFTNARGIVQAMRKASEHLRPPPNLAPSEWAESNIRIPIGNAIPGLIRFDNAPYQREPLDMTARPDCSRITLMWGAQVGKTQTGLCAQAYRIAQNPASQMMMQPSQGDLITWLETKFNPLIESNPQLQDLIAKPRGRDGVNNQRMKSYPGGFLMFAWSGSPKTMRGRSAPFILCDETDGYDRTAEGHPVGLLWQRAATFGDQRLLLEISTPTIKGASWIESAFNQGDQRYFMVPCPHCGELQRLTWAGVKWQKDQAGEHLPETARYLCQGCGSLWSDGERIAAIRRGEWQATKPWRGHASYHLSELYSCFRRLQDVVQSYLDKLAANDLQTFVNVSLAETWEEKGDQADSGQLMQRAEAYAAQVPAGGLLLTAGVDMQQDRLEVEVVAWGVGEESFSVDYAILWGDPTNAEVWQDLTEYLDQSFTREDGSQLAISAICMDTGGTGGSTQAAYQYVQEKRDRRLFAIKGVGGWGRPIVSAPTKRKAPKPGQRAVQLFTVGTDEAKLLVMRRLGITQPGPGYCHFPDSRDPEWFAQLTAEKLITRYVKGYPLREWHKTRERNEALDCRVYALAALKILQPNLGRLAEKQDIQKQKAPKPQPVEAEQKIQAPEQPTQKQPAPATKRPRQSAAARGARSRRGSWAVSW